MDITQFLLLTLHCETLFYTSMNKGMFLFVYELLIIDLISELMNVFLIRLNYKLTLSSGYADNHNLKTTVCEHVTVVCGVSPIEHAPYNLVFLSKL